MSFYGRFFRIVRPIARLFCCIRDVPERDPAVEPCVFICRHKNLQGPIYSMLNLKTPTRPWSLDVFCERDVCYRHYRDYTFTERLGWPAWWAEIVARLASRVVPALLHSIGGIPVYRGSARIASTFRKSLAALKRGECLIIYPDIEYTDSKDGELAFYEGYLILDRLYRNATGKALRFLPMFVDVAASAIRIGEPVMFLTADPVEYGEEKHRVASRIMESIQSLSKG